MNTGERTHLGASLLISEWHPAGLGKHDAERLRMISKLRTSPRTRRQGHATWLLAEVCAEADLAGVVLVLEPIPDADSPLGVVQLCDWYAQYGFAKANEAPLLMARWVRQCVL